MPDVEYPPPGAPEPNRDQYPAPSAPPPGLSPSGAQFGGPGSGAGVGVGAGVGWPGPPPRPMGVARPGAVPLRPLRLGDLLDGSVRIIRRNAGATVGASLLVSAVALLIPLVGTAAVAALVDVSGWQDADASLGDTEAAALVATLVAWVSGVVVQSLAVVIVAGMCAHVTFAAAAGRTLSLGRAWAATRGHRWKLIGAATLVGLAMTILIALYVTLVAFASVYGGWPGGLSAGLLGGLALLGILAWLWIRVYLLLTPVIAVEGLGVMAALKRAVTLSQGHFWRLFGISLLVLLVLQVVAGIVSMPLSILAVLPGITGASPGLAFFAEAAGQGLVLTLTTALVTPVTATLAALFALDLKMRKEAFDVVLLQESQTPSAAAASATQGLDRGVTHQ